MNLGPGLLLNFFPVYVIYETLNKENNGLKVFVEEYEVGEIPHKHPSVFEPWTVVFGGLMGLLGIIIGLELLTRLGITPNTSIIGALISITVSRIPITIFRSFRDLSRQNLMQTVISGATFGGANAILVPMGILWLMGETKLVPAVMFGALLGLLIDTTIIYKVFDSKIYPARGIWPPGIAAAECIIAGDRGGKRAKLLGIGGAAGALGRSLGIPMEIFGVCWIGNIWAMAMLGVGLLIRGYSKTISGIDVNDIYLPHGVMIGAGTVAMIQILFSITTGKQKNSEIGHSTVSGKQFVHRLGAGFIAFAAAAAVMAAAAGIYASLPPVMLALFILFAAAAALVSELIVGIAAMHAGWFPAFAATLVFLVPGMLIGFPPLPLAFLVGFTASTGPAFADMGYDLKAGWILRGSGKYPEYEKQGRREQYYAELLGFALAVIFIALFYKNYFTNNLVPPVDRVFVSTIQAGTNPGVAKYLFIWMVPGGILQLLGGPSRQIGILLATGLLIMNPAAGWTVLAALLTRILLVKKYGQSISSPMYVMAGGFIAGSALSGFAAATLKLK